MISNLRFSSPASFSPLGARDSVKKSMQQVKPYGWEEAAGKLGCTITKAQTNASLLDYIKNKAKYCIICSVNPMLPITTSLQISQGIPPRDLHMFAMQDCNKTLYVGWWMLIIIRINVMGQYMKGNDVVTNLCCYWCFNPHSSGSFQRLEPLKCTVIKRCDEPSYTHQRLKPLVCTVCL